MTNLTVNQLLGLFDQRDEYDANYWNREYIPKKPINVSDKDWERELEHRDDESMDGFTEDTPRKRQTTDLG